MELMRPIHHTCRWLALVSLIFSLGLSSFVPNAMAEVQSGAQVMTQEASDCCCETRNGRCCGMACCIVPEAPAPEPTPVPARGDHRDGESTSLSLALAKSLLSDLEANAESRFAQAENRAACSADESSLQARHVRLNA